MTELLTPQRLKIVKSLKSKLEKAGYYVTRRLLAVEDLTGAQLPAVAITNGPERDKPSHQGDFLEGAWELHLVIYVKDLVGEPQDRLEIESAKVVSICLEDHTVGGEAIDIDLVSRDGDRGVFSPYAMTDLGFNIEYTFDRINQGG